MFFGNQKFLVAGMSKSGAASTDFLLRRGAVVYMYDDIEDAAVKSTMQSLAARGANILPRGGIAAAVNDCDGRVLTPGVPIEHVPARGARCGDGYERKDDDRHHDRRDPARGGIFELRLREHRSADHRKGGRVGV